MKKKLILAGGGTGGHLFPGMAVAEEWQKRGGNVLFVGSARGMEKKLLPQYGFALTLLPASILKGGGFVERLKVLVTVPRALFKSLILLQREKPDVVLGIGGYASGPVVLAAWMLRIKTALIEQNAVPGLTNRWLKFFVRHVFITFKKAASFFKSQTVKVTGNPAMNRIVQNAGKKIQLSQLTLMLCGGSQGSHRLNEVFLEAAPKILNRFPHLKIYHQTGERDFEVVKQKWDEKKTDVVVAPFFHDMEEKYATTSLVIGRAGAGTVTELALWGLPSILVPYPFAADDHQQKNAEALWECGAAELIQEKDLTSSLLEERISKILSDEHLRKKMSEAALTWAKPNAAKDIVDELMRE